MGRPKCKQSIQHFSHPHPLELSNPQQQQTTSNLPPCAACKLEPSGLIYICKACNFILHLSCSEKPQFINHPSDPNHPLTLLPFPAYPEGAFTCDACDLQDTGFCYHCTACTLDLHINCASMPISLNHQAHPHTLRLSIRLPSQAKSFKCDMCDRVVDNQWCYECRACDFDAHLSCASNPLAQANDNRPKNGLGTAVQGSVQGSSSGNDGDSALAVETNHRIAMHSLKMMEQMAYQASNGARYDSYRGVKWNREFFL